MLLIPFTEEGKGDRVCLNFLGGCGRWNGEWMRLRRAWVFRFWKRSDRLGVATKGSD